MSQNNAASLVQEYNEALKKEAEDLVLKDFPEKIIELNELLKSPVFYQKYMAEMHEDLNLPIPDPVISENTDGAPAKRPRIENECSCPGVDDTSALVLPKGKVPCNRSICDLVGLVKPHIQELIKNANLAERWISNMIPKIESDDSLGVSIQKKTLEKVTTVKNEAGYFFQDISRYFDKRGKAVSKVAKHPHIEDYRRSVAEIDENQYLRLWIVLSEVRNRYSQLHDLVIKNLEKIKNPLPENDQGLY